MSELKRQACEDFTETLVDRILQSYSELGGINHLEGPNLPSQQSIARIVETLEALIFPGFHAEEKLDMVGLRYAIGDKVVWLTRAGSGGGEESLRYTCRIRNDCGRHEDCIGEAREIVQDLLENVPAVRRMLSLDVEAADRGDRRRGRRRR